MSSIILLVGLALAACIMVDLIGSTFLPSRFRFIAFRVELLVWRCVSALGDALGDQRIRTYAGPAILFSIFVAWIGGAWIAWSVVFIASPEAVVGLAHGESAAFWDRVYYVGGLLSTLGTGDFGSGTPFWRLLSVVASLAGLTIITLSISNFVTVVFALSETRALAAELHSLGESGAEMLRAGWDGESFAPLMGRLDGMLSRIFIHADRAAAFGTVNHFVHSERHRALAPSIAALDDALMLLRYAVAEERRPHGLTPVQLLRAIELAIPVPVRPAAAPWPVAEGMAHLAADGIPLRPDAAASEPAARDRHRRDRLAGWLNSNGWDWRRDAMPAPGPAGRDRVQRGSMA